VAKVVHPPPPFNQKMRRVEKGMRRHYSGLLRGMEWRGRAVRSFLKKSEHPFEEKQEKMPAIHARKDIEMLDIFIYVFLCIFIDGILLLFMG
jgi:hypothetical protein